MGTLRYNWYIFWRGLVSRNKVGVACTTMSQLKKKIKGMF